MLKAYIGDQKDEGRMRIGDTGPRQIIQWISKAWTTHELTLPVFYRESLARILSLEKFRNLIETNIEAGITTHCILIISLHCSRTVYPTRGN